MVTLSFDQQYATFHDVLECPGRFADFECFLVQT